MKKGLESCVIVVLCSNMGKKIDKHRNKLSQMHRQISHIEFDSQMSDSICWLFYE